MAEAVQDAAMQAEWEEVIMDGSVEAEVGCVNVNPMGMGWRHVGDGVYARFDGYHVVIKTMTAGEIYLEPSTFDSLYDFAEQVWGGDE